MTEWILSKAGLVMAASGALLGSAIIATASDVGAYEKFLATFGVLAALVWFMWHNQTKVIPNLNKAHRQDVDRICKENTESTERICNRFAETSERFAETTERIEQRHSEQMANACKFQKPSA